MFHRRPKANTFDLSRLDRSARAAVLASAIRHSNDPERAPLIAAMVECVTAPGTWRERAMLASRALARRARIRVPEAGASELESLVSVWDLLGDDVRQVGLYGPRDELTAAALAAAGRDDSSARRAAAIALRDIQTAGAFAGLVALLGDPEALVAGTADRAIVSCVESWVTSEEEVAVDVRAVGQALAEGLASGQGERLRGCATAALILMNPSRLSHCSGERLRPLADLLESQGEGSTAVRSLLRGSRHPLARLRALEWLSREPLQEACIQRLGRASDLDEHNAVLTSVHLLINPRRAMAARQIAKAGGIGNHPPRSGGGEVGGPASGSLPQNGPLPKPQDIPSLTPRAKWGLSQWASMIGAPAPVRKAVLEPLLLDPSPGVRLSAARVASHEDLTDFCFDEDVAVARTATIRWSLLGVGRSGGKSTRGQNGSVSRERLLMKLARSPHAAVRRIAIDDLRLIDPVIAATCGDVSPSAAIAAGGLPQTLAKDIHRDLSWANPERASRALRVIHRTATAGQFQEPLAKLLEVRASTPEASPLQERVAATVVSTLAEVAPGERVLQAVKALDEALHDRDPRVQANAVDGLARDIRRSGDHALPSILVELKSDRHHRVRASALRGLLWSVAAPGTRGSADMMMEMLCDGRSGHRLAGVWLCERWALGTSPPRDELSAACERLRDLMDRDIDERIVARARRASHRIKLLHSLADDLRPVEAAA